MVRNPLIGPAICWGKRGIGVCGPLKFPIINEFCFCFGAVFALLWFFDGLDFFSRFLPFFFFVGWFTLEIQRPLRKNRFSPSRLFSVK